MSERLALMFARSHVAFGVGVYRPAGLGVAFERLAHYTLILSYAGISRRIDGLYYDDAEFEADQFMRACHAWEAVQARQRDLDRGYAVIHWGNR